MTILAIDQGTSSSRALIFDESLQVLAKAQVAFKQHYPQQGWVEHQPEDLWQTTLQCCRKAIEDSGVPPQKILGLGITNQRETTLVWDRQSGTPIYPAIVWQDRRTADICARLKQQGHEEAIQASTGLCLDPYFSASKVSWILDQVEGAREEAARGKLCFGTVDTWLIWKLSGGKHVTEATNASRTMLYNIHRNLWDESILDLLNIPKRMLPEVLDSCGDFGHCEKEHLGAEIPILAVLGDQQAAAVGQACLFPGMIKSTYGTGCFAILNTGAKAISSRHRLLTTIAYRLRGETCYALEGSIFMAGAIVQWLRDELGFVKTAEQTEILSKHAKEQDVILVPAFTGLGAPYWQPNARAALFGMTRDTSRSEIVRAALESIGLQSHDLVAAMQKDLEQENLATSVLRVDGGMANNDTAMQFLADILDQPVERPKDTDTTVLGAALFASLQSNIFSNLEDLAKGWSCAKRFAPGMEATQRTKKITQWSRAVQACLSMSDSA